MHAANLIPFSKTICRLDVLMIDAMPLLICVYDAENGYITVGLVNLTVKSDVEIMKKEKIVWFFLTKVEAFRGR